MRIKSNFKDYYDSIQQYIYGPSSTYLRSWCSMGKSNSDLLLNNECFNFDYDSSFVVGFCGKIYGGIQKFIIEEKIEGRKSWEPNIRYIYDYVWSLEQWMNGRKRFESWQLWMSSEEIKEREKNFFVKNDHSVFIEENCPIFYIDKNYSVCCPLNPQRHQKFNKTLGSIHFDTIIRPEEAYTSLVDYISFLGMEHKTLPEMANKVKIASHGFNKDSFRSSKVKE